MRRARIALALLAALVGAAPPAVRACGHCVEDKVAATYDYAVLTAAARRGHVVVYTEIRGRVAGAPPATAHSIAGAIAATPGVDAGTVRVSLDPPAASFACDPARSPEAIVHATRTRLAPKGFELGVIKVDAGPKHSGFSDRTVSR